MILREVALRPGTRGAAARYGIGLAAVVVAIALAEAMEPLTGPDFYPPLIGAVAVAVWFGGVGPALLAIAFGWGLRLGAAGGPVDDRARWLTGLAVALAIVWITSAMRAAEAKAAARTAEATRSGRFTERLQGLTADLAAAATPVDVARALVERGASVVRADAGMVGLVIGEEIELVDLRPPEGGARLPGARLPLDDRSMLGHAVREAELAWASTAAEMVDRFPAGVAGTRAPRGAVAVPLRVGDEVVGAVAFEYGQDHRIDEERLALAQLAADLGSQALERARLYDEERAVREGLDRVLRVAPRAGVGSPEEVTAEICREARRTFSSDVALMLSIVDDDRFSVDWRDPAAVLAPPGLLLPIDDLPDLQVAADRGEVMWVPDLHASLRGEALEIAKTLGTVSALRIPIALPGRFDRVLVLQWNQRTPDPSPALLALARRFADQAGLALEQSHRRLAEELAQRRAEETRRLLELTSALAGATTTDDVIDVLLGHGALALRADRGVVALHEGDDLVVGGTTGARVDAVGRRIPVDEPLPLTEAFRRNEIVVVESVDDLSLRYPLLDRLTASVARPASISVPLVARGGAIGAAAFGFEHPQRIDEAQRQLLAAIARQSSEALERARLHEAESAARARAERAAASLAQLHALGTALGRARSEGEVADAVSRQITGVLGARSAALYVVDEPAAELRAVGQAGEPSSTAERYARVPVGDDLPIAVAVRTGEAAWSTDQHSSDLGDGVWTAAGVTAWGVVPMVVEGRAVGVLAVGFEGDAVVDEEARRFVETVARNSGQPLDRVRLLDAERRSRVSAEEASDRTNRLQSAAEALAIALTTSEVANTALAQATEAVEAGGGLLYLRPPGAGADQLELAAAAGSLGDLLADSGHLPMPPPTPDTYALTDGGVVEHTADELAVRFPEIAEHLGLTSAEMSISVPLVLGTRMVGALLLVRDGDPLDEDDRELLLTLGAQSAQALERARLLDAEQAAAMRLRRLHAITAALSSAATVEEVGRATLVEAAAAVGAVEGVIALRRGDGFDVVASIGSAPQSLEPVVADVVRTSLPVWAFEGGEVTAAPLGDAVVWAGVPLTGSRGVVGALVLGFAAPGQLSVEDRTWLVAVGAQCAGALERSRLYDVERETRARVERLQRLTAMLSTSLTPTEVSRVVLAEGRDALGADSAALIGLAEGGETLEILEAVGVLPDIVDGWNGARLEVAGPVTDSLRSKRAVFLEKRASVVGRYEPVPALLDEHAWAVAPLLVGERAVAALSFSWQAPRAFGAEERAFVETLARQSAQALDRARRHASERQIAETLQRSMLPDPIPDLPGVALATRYRPGTAGLEVGGDWYDVVPLATGRVGLAVGDVVGKGVRAASTMGQLRNALRAFALEPLPPAAAVGRLNALVDTFADVPFATLVYMALDCVRGVCSYTVAGHPPPLLLQPSGVVQRLEGGRSLPLGVDSEVEFEQSTAALDPGSTIVLYTDGLVERPGRSLEEGLRQLERSLQGADAAELDPETLADRILGDLLVGDQRDDVALLVVKLAPALEGVALRVPAEPAALVGLRSDVRTWLERAGASSPESEDILLACWEACANAIQHGSNGDVGHVTIDLSLSDGVVDVCVADGGSWRGPVEREGRGYGLRMVQMLMDSVRVDPSPRGTIVRMTRALGVA